MEGKMNINKAKKSSILFLLLLAAICFSALAFTVGKNADAAVGDVYSTQVFVTDEHTSKDVIAGKGWWFHSDEASSAGSKVFELNKDLVNKFIAAGYTSVDIKFNGGGAFGERDHGDSTYFNSTQPLFTNVAVSGFGAGGTVSLGGGQLADLQGIDPVSGNVPLSVSLNNADVDYVNYPVKFVVPNVNNLAVSHGIPFSQDCFVTSVAFKGEGKTTYEFTEDGEIEQKDYILPLKETTSVTYYPNRGWRIDSTDGQGNYDDTSKAKVFYINTELIASYYEDGYTTMSVAFCKDGLRFGYDPNLVSSSMANFVLCQAFSNDGNLTHYADIFQGEGYIMRAENNLGYGESQVLDIGLESYENKLIRFVITNLYSGTDSFAEDGIMSAYVSYIKFSGSGKEDVYLSGPKDMGEGFLNAGEDTVITVNNDSYKVQSSEETMENYDGKKEIYIKKEIIAAYREAGATSLVLGFDDGRQYGLPEGGDYWSMYSSAYVGNQLLWESNNFASNWEYLGGVPVMKVVIPLDKAGVNYDHNIRLSFSNRFAGMDINKEVYISYMGFSDGENDKKVSVNTIDAVFENDAIQAESDYGYYQSVVAQFGAENVKVGVIAVPSSELPPDEELTVANLTENGVPYEDISLEMLNESSAVADGCYDFAASANGLTAGEYTAVAYIKSTENLLFDNYVYSDEFVFEVPSLATLGAAVRLDDEGSLRVISRISKAELEKLDCDSYKIGTLFKGGTLTGALMAETAGAVKIENEGAYWSEDENSYIISAYIYGISAEHYADTVNACVYIEVHKNGETTYIYGNVIERSLAGIAAEALADVKDVSEGDYIYQTEDGKYSKYNDTEREKLAGYVE